MRIVGITGTLGAGKGTVVDYLVKNLGFKHFSVRAFLITKIEERGMPVNRDSMFEVANGMRKEGGAAAVIENMFDAAAASGAENCIIESVRCVGEVEALRKKSDFTFLAVDADAQVRYDRVVVRGSETDKVSFETFIENETREMTNTDPTKQNLKACMEMADVKIDNSADLESLFSQIKSAFE
eukprot:TRINITY_DN594_c0_g1_i1.p1 TRINITY_DN594_c0_g1~~TRINITY_DN594_c0_g1_i1.p1  ORF type:complete len:183 (+),score=58.02 TRINITY_DN594_c0_g1_i1:28-576(+)